MQDTFCEIYQWVWRKFTSYMVDSLTPLLGSRQGGMAKHHVNVVQTSEFKTDFSAFYFCGC